ncbi:hypothetical protein K505DRAFT_89779 [Melanomma pulvis-pyrius CBS 109.77]|uniref:Uncharacterized protein n=1 Tax=Melanomma pulvis-pyrius CBS 109.77 TaxID=1314802 RepID=A0A6A6X090_9PLEO|nr:hypothetical protein K505DRAFT_89779 [Melanomma pulvis-pyrius CBS 109.77]
MNELRIHTHIHSRYQVFDVSGKLQFSIVFSLCRRSPADTDPRSLLLQIAGSVLDVPYALAHGLLTLHKQNAQDATQWVEEDLSRLDKVAAKGQETISLPSPVNRTEHWRDAFTVYQCHIDVNGVLASVLEPGKKYRIALKSEDLGVKRWAYSAQKQFVDSDGKPSHDYEAAKLVNSKSTSGNATFKVVKSLPWPPRVETRMRLCAASPSYGSTLTNVNLGSGTTLEVSVVNTGSDTVTVQTRGHQTFLIPWGPFQPEADADDHRMRIIDASPHKPSISSLQVVDSATGEVVRGNEKGGTGPLIDPKVDQRPKVEDLLTLDPETPVVRVIDIGMLVNGLEDGQYKIRMQPKGCRWWHGVVEKEVGEDGRVLAHLNKILTVPLMLESKDEVQLCIRGGKVDQTS